MRCGVRDEHLRSPPGSWACSPIGEAFPYRELAEPLTLWKQRRLHPCFRISPGGRARLLPELGISGHRILRPTSRRTPDDFQYLVNEPHGPVSA